MTCFLNSGFPSMCSQRVTVWQAQRVLRQSVLVVAGQRGLKRVGNLNQFTPLLLLTLNPLFLLVEAATQKNAEKYQELNFVLKKESITYIWNTWVMMNRSRAASSWGKRWACVMFSSFLPPSPNSTKLTTIAILLVFKLPLTTILT